MTRGRDRWMDVEMDWIIEKAGGRTLLLCRFCNTTGRTLDLITLYWARLDGVAGTLDQMTLRDVAPGHVAEVRVPFPKLSQMHGQRQLDFVYRWKSGDAAGGGGTKLPVTLP